MGFGVGDIVQAALLLINAVAILSERRVLAKWGLDAAHGHHAAVGAGSASAPSAFGDNSGFHFGDSGAGGNGSGFIGGAAMRGQIAQLLASVRMLLRWPLIFVNIATIIFALVFG